MIQLILTVGVPSSGKSTWAKQKVAEDPTNWVRINNDSLREMMNGSVFTNDYEKLIKSTREFIVLQALKSGKNVIVDNLNLGKRNFEDYCKLAQSSGKQVKVLEKSFYVELSEAIKRDSERTGSAKVGPEVIGKWWKASGGKQHKLYVCREEVFVKVPEPLPMEHVEGLPNAIIVDIDGTLQKNHHGRSYYDASTCDQDVPNIPVIETVKMFHDKGYEIIFCSGREDKYKDPTERFFKKHIPDVKYVLHMRTTDDQRKDSIIKPEIFDKYIRNKYNVLLVLDDRKQVVDSFRNLGLTVFQVAPGDF